MSLCTSKANNFIFSLQFRCSRASIHTKLRSWVVKPTLSSALGMEFNQKPSEATPHQRVKSVFKYRNLAPRLAHQMKAQESKPIWDPNILTGRNRLKNTRAHFSKANMCSDLYLPLIIYLSETSQARYVQVQNLLLCISSCTFDSVGEKVRKQLRKQLFGLVKKNKENYGDKLNAHI